MANRVSRCLNTLETRPQEKGALEKGNGPSRYQMRTSRLPSTAAQPNHCYANQQHYREQPASDGQWRPAVWGFRLRHQDDEPG